MRRVALVLLAVALAGCESTQSKSSRLKSQAENRPDAKPFVITKANPKVRFGVPTVLEDDNGVAVVLPVKAKVALTEVPISFELLGKSGKRVYRNDTPGLDTSLVQVPLLERGEELLWVDDPELLWVDDQIVGAEGPHKARAKAGEAKPLTGKAPELELKDVKLAEDPTEGLSVTGAVTNRSQVEQRRLVVYIVGRKDGRVTAAGRSIVPRLKVGKTAKFTAFLIGDAKGVELTAAAPPTRLK